MATKLSIGNRALIKIGEQRVHAITDDTENARLINAMYEDDKRAVLELHTWKFARKHANLAQNSTDPSFGYEKSFELPSDFIRIVYFNNTEPEYRTKQMFEIVGQELHTDQDLAQITYVRDVDTPGIFSAGFVECLSSYMAANLAYARTQSQPLYDRLMLRFQKDLSAAKKADASGDNTPRPDRLGFTTIAARFKGRT